MDQDNEQVIRRELPRNIEAERSVIASMLMDRDSLDKACELLSADDFYNKQHSVVFEAMVELNEKNEEVDLITLQNRLREKGMPAEVSSLEFLRELSSDAYSIYHLEQYCAIVREKSLLRRLIRVNEDIAGNCYAGKEETNSILEDAEKRIFDLVQRRNTGEFVPIRKIVADAMNQIERASKMDGNLTGIATGFLDLDYKTAGLQNSDLILIAARPSMGKTAFVLNIAEYACIHSGLPVAIFSLEMSKQQLVNRLLAMESKVDAQKIRSGNLSDA